MEHHGIDVTIANKPRFEPTFIPLYKFIQGFLASANEPYCFAVERNKGYITRFNTMVHGTADQEELDLYYLKLIIRFSFKAWGGWKIYLGGNPHLSDKIAAIIQNDPEMAMIGEMARQGFKKELVIEKLSYEACPENDGSEPVGRHLNGCRIGIDCGGSDRKVSALIDGKVIYSEEVIWIAKFTADIDYHYNEILTAFKTAAAKLPRVDAIGVSTAGPIVDNLMMGASFFMQVPPEDVAKKGRDIFQRAAKEIGENIPIVLANDGEISALAGSMACGKNKLLGIPIGTSIGCGYVDSHGNLSDKHTEMSGAQLALNEDALKGEWADLTGTGDAYFSQRNVIRLAKLAGIEIPDDILPAEQLIIVQKHMEDDDPKAQAVFKSIACCFAHTVPLWTLFYELENVYLMGRVVSGKGGDLFVEEINRILAEEYPETKKQVTIWLPDENDRRVMQSVAAASLPIVPQYE